MAAAPLPLRALASYLPYKKAVFVCNNCHSSAQLQPAPAPDTPRAQAQQVSERSAARTPCVTPRCRQSAITQSHNTPGASRGIPLLLLLLLLSLSCAAVQECGAEGATASELARNPVAVLRNS